MDLYEEIQRLTNELDVAVRSLRKTGSDYAKAEHDYKIKLAQEAFKLKENGTASTLINTVIYRNRRGSKFKNAKRCERSYI